MISAVSPSTRAGKRYTAIWDGKAIDFGSRGATTFIDGATEKTRENYWKRHRGSPREKTRLANLTPSASVLSAYLLWGDSRDLQTNLRALNAKLR